MKNIAIKRFIHITVVGGRIFAFQTIKYFKNLGNNV